MRKSIIGLATLVAGSAIGLGAAQAETVAALIGDATLAHVDTAAGKVVKTVTVTGISGTILGIDVRPADGMLYGVVSDGSIVTIDPMSGKATAKSKLDTTLAAGVMATVDSTRPPTGSASSARTARTSGPMSTTARSRRTASSSSPTATP